MFFVICSSYIKVINHLHRNRRKASDFYFSHKPKMSSRKQIATFQILVQMEGVTATARRKFFTERHILMVSSKKYCQLNFYFKSRLPVKPSKYSIYFAHDGP